jgi:hypothetical protein
VDVVDAMNVVDGPGFGSGPDGSGMESHHTLPTLPDTVPDPCKTPLRALANRLFPYLSPRPGDHATSAVEVESGRVADVCNRQPGGGRRSIARRGSINLRTPLFSVVRGRFIP